MAKGYGGYKYKMPYRNVVPCMTCKYCTKHCTTINQMREHEMICKPNKKLETFLQ